jgi:predicted permease
MQTICRQLPFWHCSGFDWLLALTPCSVLFELLPCLSLGVLIGRRRGNTAYFGIPIVLALLPAAAPTAISVLLVAETQQRDQHAAALVVLRSRALALVTVPLWCWFLQNGLP